MRILMKFLLVLIIAMGVFIAYKGIKITTGVIDKVNSLQKEQQQLILDLSGIDVDDGILALPRKNSIKKINLSRLRQ